jgi:hypothetical protein
VPAGAGRVRSWAAGVETYYDPAGLHALVAETMACKECVEWRVKKALTG